MSALIRKAVGDGTADLCSPLELTGMLDRGERAEYENKHWPEMVHVSQGFRALVSAAYAAIYRPATSGHNAAAAIEVCPQ